jgi:hypothetical protein
MSLWHDNVTNLSWHGPCLATSVQPVPFYRAQSRVVMVCLAEKTRSSFCPQILDKLHYSLLHPSRHSTLSDPVTSITIPYEVDIREGQSSLLPLHHQPMVHHGAEIWHCVAYVSSTYSCIWLGSVKCCRRHVMCRDILMSSRHPIK